MIQIASSTYIPSNSFTFDVSQTSTTQSQEDFDTYKVAHSILFKQAQAKTPVASSSKSDIFPLNHFLNNPYSFDEILNLLDEVESGEAERKYSPEKLEKIKHFIVHLARQGTSPDYSKKNLSLENDIEELFHEEGNSSCQNFFCFENQKDDPFVSTVRNESRCGEKQFVLYKKGWIKNTCKQVGSFAKKHKKEILIGAIIVAAIATVVLVAVAASSSAAGGIGAAEGGAAKALADKADKQKIDAQKQTEEKNNSDLTAKPINRNQSPTLESTFNEKVSQFKKTAEKDLSYLPHSAKGHENAAMEETLRNLGSNFAHEVLDEVAGVVRVIPQFFEEAKDLGHKILPESILPREDTVDITPKKNFETIVTTGHEKIDQTFSTEKASYYGPDAKKPYGEFTIGMFPPPGNFTRIPINVNKFVKGGKILDRRELTKAGRGLMKKSYRDGSVYPRPTGTPAQINEQGQKTLESILYHPEKISYEYNHSRDGKVVEVVIPDGRGVRFTSDGEMICFLEPNNGNR